MPTPTLRRATRLFAAAAGFLLLAAPAAFGQDPAPAAEAAKAQSNIFVHIISSVGFFWLILLPTSVWLVAMVVLLALDLRMSAAIPTGFVDEFTDTVNKRKFKEAYDLAAPNPATSAARSPRAWRGSSTASTTPARRA